MLFNLNPLSSKSFSSISNLTFVGLFSSSFNNLSFCSFFKPRIVYYTQVLLKIPCINQKRRFDNMAFMRNQQCDPSGVE